MALALGFAASTGCVWDWDALGIDGGRRRDASDVAVAPSDGATRPDTGSAPCGVPGRPCCEGGSCNAAVASCVMNVCLACGHLGLPCCAGANACDATTNCNRARDLCITCGLRSSVCCTEGATACQEGLTCTVMADGGFGARLCECGIEGTRCCGDTTCDPGLRCDSQMCRR